jgi:nicotinamidase-related amidase
VIFTRHAHKKDGSDLGVLGEWWDEMPIDGTPEAELDERVLLQGDRRRRTTKRSREYILTKSRYSAFIGTRLEAILKRHKVKEVVITGVMTSICCETTARDAFMRDYMVRFVADATGSPEERMHMATLYNLAYAFADICTTKELLFARAPFALKSYKKGK